VVFASAGVGQAGSEEGVPENAAVDGNRLVKPRLVTERTAFVPGESTTIGVHLVIEKGWHVYWRNNGDSGMPVSITFEPIDGVTIGASEWPAPMRHLSEGDILDYIYEDQVTLLFPLNVSDKFSAGTNISLKAKVEWLVCKDLCLPGDREIELSVPVSASASESADSGLIRAARATLPRTPTAGTIHTKWDSRVLDIHVPGALSLSYFPYESEDGVVPLSMIERGTAKGDRLQLEYDEHVDHAEHVRGVVEVRRDGKTSEYLLLDVEGPRRE
jgi:thiol:disulfide interchange protein DsbD